MHDEQEEEQLNEINSIKEHTTKQTMGAGLAGMKDDLQKSYNATEKLGAVDEEKFYDPENQGDNYTDVDKVKDDVTDKEGFEMFDEDEVIQPAVQKQQGIFSEQTVELVQQSWEKVEALGLEKVGIVLFKNIFKIAPGALQLFSFKDEEDLYSSEALKSHGMMVVKTVGVAVSSLETMDDLIPVL